MGCLDGVWRCIAKCMAGVRRRVVLTLQSLRRFPMALNYINISILTIINMYLAVVEKVPHGVVVAVAHVSVRPNARLPCGVGRKVKHGVKLYKYIII